jgi:nucleotide-binding universal stress UspA family protein
MEFLIGYNGSDVSNSALSLVRDHAKVFNARVSVLVSMEGGAGETPEDVNNASLNLDYAKAFLEEEGVSCETYQLARGRKPAEDIVKFAEDNQIDLIYVGIKKKSNTQ